MGSLGKVWVRLPFLPTPSVLPCLALPSTAPSGTFVRIKGRGRDEEGGCAGVGKQWRASKLQKSWIYYTDTCLWSNCFSLITLPYHPSFLCPLHPVQHPCPSPCHLNRFSPQNFPLFFQLLISTLQVLIQHFRAPETSKKKKKVCHVIFSGATSARVYRSGPWLYNNAFSGLLRAK